MTPVVAATRAQRVACVEACIRGATLVPPVWKVLLLHCEPEGDGTGVVGVCTDDAAGVAGTLAVGGAAGLSPFFSFTFCTILRTFSVSGSSFSESEPGNIT